MEHEDTGDVPLLRMDKTKDARMNAFQAMEGKEGHHAHHLTEEERELMQSYESLDYDVVENRLYRETQLDMSSASRSRRNCASWVLFFLIGASTGITAFIVETLVDKLSKAKFNVALSILPNGDGANRTIGEACVAYVGMSVAFAFVSAMLVTYLAPVAQGSGIPEIKAYLNGNNVPKVLAFPTLIAKAVGVVFSNSAGLAIGKEGPMIHSGSVWAAVYSHLPKLPKLTGARWLRVFRTDHFKRDFVSGGAAAGVAAAFGAPMGGVLFSLEEASSFWSLALTWKVFFCAMSSSFALNICSSYYHGYTYLNSPGQIDFGVFSAHGYYLWEMPFFWLIAVAGGFAGALFNAINIRITKFRKDKLHRVRILKVLEVCMVMFVTAMCQFWAPKAFEDDCRPIPGYVGPTGNVTSPMFKAAEGPETYQRYLCPEGFYNMEATLIFTTGHDGIKAFFHDSGYFSYQSLVLYGCLYFVFAVVTYGIAVPSGLFVPCILTGAAFGRMAGNLVQSWFPHHSISVGSYALVGAVAMLGGILRMTISLTMIVLETTSDIQFLLPIMTTLMISKWVGDLFNISLYDLHIEIKAIPFVESIPPNSMVHLTAQDIMATPVITFQQLESVRFVMETLQSCTHNGFPVVDPDHGNVLVGIVTRAQLLILIHKKAFMPPHIRSHRGFAAAPVDSKAEPDLRRRRTSSAARRQALDLDATAQEPLPPNIDLLDFSTSWSSKPQRMDNVQASLTSDDYDRVIDMRPWCNQAPYTVTANWPTSRVFRVFRAMGLRHLIVVDNLNSVVGIITRKAIRTDFSVDLS